MNIDLMSLLTSGPIKTYGVSPAETSVSVYMVINEGASAKNYEFDIDEADSESVIKNVVRYMPPMRRGRDTSIVYRLVRKPGVADVGGPEVGRIRVLPNGKFDTDGSRMSNEIYTRWELKS